MLINYVSPSQKDRLIIFLVWN